MLLWPTRLGLGINYPTHFIFYQAWIYGAQALPSPYQMGMVKQLRIESCEPDWTYVERLATDHEAKLDSRGEQPVGEKAKRGG